MLSNVIVISAVLGRNSQNKPNGFSIHVVLRSGAEMWFYYLNLNIILTAQQRLII